MKLLNRILVTAIFSSNLAAFAGVSTGDAEKLGKELTPLGAERSGNKAGTIPSWTGGYTDQSKASDHRSDPFHADKPLYTVTSKNLSQYEALLTDGLKAMFSKNADFRLDVYTTRRTAAAPKYVYENTKLNATRASMKGDAVIGAYAGIPFPIPKTGSEAIWNSVLYWSGKSYKWNVTGWLITSDGKPVLTLDAKGDVNRPYYDEAGSLEEFEKSGQTHFQVKIVNAGPPVRAGEAFLTNKSLDPNKDEAWVYLTGQRRVRKLPNACCDTPAPQTAGIMTFDEQLVFSGRLDRMDWKLVGKQEMIIPYNVNRLNIPKKELDVIGKNFLNPDHVRWELHRVWIVEANVKAGQRHQTPRSRYYLDEDTWMAVLADRWDAKGQLWKTLLQYPYVQPEAPATTAITFEMHDLISGTWFVNGIQNSSAKPLEYVRGFAPANFQPEALAAESIR